MATRYVTKEWEVEGVLTNVTSAKLSDPTGTYGIKETVSGTVIVADGTDMTSSATGVYEYSFTDTEDIAYTAYVEIVYDGSTHRFELDIPARSAVGAMVASYSSLLAEVGEERFGIRTGFSSEQTTKIERCIKHGLRRVYGAYKWSFFRPIKEITTTAPYTTGTITIASGVVTLSGGTFPSWAAVGVLKVDDEYYDVDTRNGDTQVTLEDTSVTEASASSYELGRPEYDLDAAVEAIDWVEFVYEPGQADGYPVLEQRHDQSILSRRQDDPYHDRPRFFGIRTVEFDPTVGSRQRLSLYPTPDAAYVLKTRMKLRATMIDETNQYPVGGESLSQIITEACLAAAELNYDEKPGIHDNQYRELLPLAIAADLDMTSPRSLGPDAPKGEPTSNTNSRAFRMAAISLDGVTL